MQIHDNQRDKSKYIVAWIKETGDPNEHPRKVKVPVSDEVYSAYYQPVWRERDRARRHGGCSTADWRACGGDCGICPHRIGGDDWSLEYHIEKTGFDPADPNPDTETEVLEMLFPDTIEERLKDLDSESRLICIMIASGKTEREAAELMGLSKTTFHDRKERLFKRLKAEWRDLK